MRFSTSLLWTIPSTFNDAQDFASCCAISVELFFFMTK